MPPPSTVTEVKDLVSHMRKVASCIKSHYYIPHDDEYDRFSVNLFKLASDIETFVKKKNNEE